MRTKLLAIAVVLAGHVASGQKIQQRVLGSPPPTVIPGPVAYVPGPHLCDPGRIVGGRSYTLAAEMNGQDGWYLFNGQVSSLTANGAIIYGNWGTESATKTFIVTNLPNVFAPHDNLRLGSNNIFMAHEAGLIKIGSSTLHRLDYGKPIGIAGVSPLSPEQLAAQKAKDGATRSSVIASYQARADAGDSYAQFALGRIYIESPGVRDTNQGKIYLLRAAAQGQKDAIQLLGDAFALSGAALETAITASTNSAPGAPQEGH